MGALNTAEIDAAGGDPAARGIISSPSGVIDRLKRAAFRSLRDNALTRPESTLVTVGTRDTTATAGLSQVIAFTGSDLTNLNKLTQMSGKPVNTGSTLCIQQGTPRLTNGTVQNGNLGGGRNQFFSAVETMVRFAPDGSGKLDIGWPNNNQQYPRILVDDFYVQKNPTQLAGGGVQYDHLDFTKGGTVSVAELAMRPPVRLRIEWQLNLGLYSIRASANDQIYAVPTHDVIRAAVVGDSISVLTGVTNGQLGWEQAMAKRLGIRWVQNAGLGSTSYDQSTTPTLGSPNIDRISDLALSPVPPEVVFIASGVNSTPNADLQPKALAYYQAVRALLPGAVVIVLGTFMDQAGLTQNRLTVEDTIKAAFDQWADPWSVFVPVARAVPSWNIGITLVDTVHPDNPGHMGLGGRAADDIMTAIMAKWPR